MTPPCTPVSPTPQQTAAPGLYLGVDPCVDGVIVTIRGEIDLCNSLHLRSVLTTVLCSYEGAVTLDMSAVTFCDCSGLNELLRARHQAEGEGRPLTIRAASRRTARLLELTETAALFRPGSRPAQGRSRTVCRPAADQNAEPDTGRAGTPTDFRADLQLIGDTLLVTLHGELDLLCRPDLLAVVAPHTVAIVVDLRDVPFMDLSGLRFLAALEQRANEHGAALLTTGWQPAPLRLTDAVTRAHRAFPVLSRYVRLRRTRELRAVLTYRAALRRAIGIADAQGWEKSATALAQTCASMRPQPPL
ncbi:MULTISPECIES: STAS domain-containing protein [unclassified Streptomyces]|uniref:STAS domain-containing protein n=1 Tax=unclassified Streptomyces TaxID=2593676 RepID=UPI0013A7070E|nr:MULTISPECIES: STAS domain-containing protein [unclassified Streptomyces]